MNNGMQGILAASTTPSALAADLQTAAKNTN
jgi:hypothetical protein